MCSTYLSILSLSEEACGPEQFAHSGTLAVQSRFWWVSPRVVVSTAAFHARVRGSVPGLGGL